MQLRRQSLNILHSPPYQIFTKSASPFSHPVLHSYLYIPTPYTPAAAQTITRHSLRHTAPNLCKTLAHSQYHILDSPTLCHTVYSLTYVVTLYIFSPYILSIFPHPTHLQLRRKTLHILYSTQRQIFVKRQSILHCRAR